MSSPLKTVLLILPAAALALSLAACGSDVTQRASTGAIAGGVVAGPVGAAAGAAAGAAVAKGAGEP